MKCRASPMDKYNLVNGIMESTKNRYQEVVAMVGDGDNDALALKKADVGITFNQLSTDITKNASNIILIDNKIGGIINSVLWGRHAYDVIIKFFQFILLVKLTSVSMVGLFIFTSSVDFAIYRTDLPLNIIALIPIFFYDPIQDVMLGKPHGRSEHIISKNMIVNIFGKYLYQIVVLITFAYVYANLIASEDEYNHPMYQSQFILNIFVMMTLFDVFNARSLYGERNIFRKIQHNFLLCPIWILVFIVHVFATQYSTEKPMNLAQWGICLFFGVGILIWQQLLFACNIKRQVKTNTSEVYV